MDQREGDELDEDTYDRLVGLLYEVSLEHRRWDEPLNELAAWVGSSGFHFLGWDKQRNQSPFAQISESWTELFEGYHTHYGKIDPHIQAGFDNAAGEWLVSHHRFDKQFVSRSAYYQDYLIPGGVRHLMGTSLIQRPDLDVVIGLGRPLGSDPFSADDIRRVQRITPHLQRAVRLHMQTEDLRLSAAIGERGLDAMAIGVIAIDASCRIAYANPVAETILRAGGCLKTTLGKLATARPGANAGLRAAVQSVASAGVPHTLQAASVRDGDSDLCYLTIVPIRSRGPLAAVLSGPKVLVLVRSVSGRQAPATRQLMQLFGLTPAEGRLAEAIAKGLDLEQFAALVEVSMSTVRTQLRAVFGKTRTNRQSDLIRLLADIPVDGAISSG